VLLSGPLGKELGPPPPPPHPFLELPEGHLRWVIVESHAVSAERLVPVTVVRSWEGNPHVLHHR